MEITEQNLIELKKQVRDKIKHYGVSGLSRVTGFTRQYLWSIQESDKNFSAEKAAKLMDIIRAWEAEREKSVEN